MKGFEFYAKTEDFSALTAQVPVSTTRLLVPHFFVSKDGTTELRLLNTDDSGISVKVKAFDDTGKLLGTKDFTVGSSKLFVGDIRQLLSLDTSGLKEFEAITGYLDLELGGSFLGIFQKTPSVIGTVSFGGNGGKFYSTLPMIAEGSTETLFLHVAQSKALRIFTGLAIFNPGTTTARVRVRAFDERGTKSGEKEFDLVAGKRVVGLLNESSFLGVAFTQVKGHLRVSSIPTSSGVPPVPLVAFALFGDDSLEFLAAIEGQKPLQ